MSKKIKLKDLAQGGCILLTTQKKEKVSVDY